MGAEPRVAFDGETSRDRRPRRGEGIFDDSLRRVMQAAMGDRPRDEPSEIARHGAPPGAANKTVLHKTML